MCINLLCLSAALLCYTGFQNQSLIRSTSSYCSTCCFGYGLQLQNLQDIIKISRAYSKDTEYTLPSQITRLNGMHREISGIDDLINVADGIDLIIKYRRLWTHERMKREAPVAVSIMGVIRDLQKVCQANDWLFEDRAPFLAYKVDLLLRRHQLRGLRGTSRLGYKRYGCAPHRTQDLAVQLQEYFRLGEQTEPYAYNAVAPGAPMDLVQLATIYQTGPRRLGFHDFDKAIRRVAALHSLNEEYANLFPFVDAPELVRRLGTSKYLMSPFEAGYEDARRWR